MRSIISFALLLASAINIHAGPLKLLTTNTYDGNAQKAGNGIIELRTTGDDPQIVFELNEAETLNDAEHMLAFEYFCPDGVDFVEVFYSQSATNPNWSQSRQLEGGSLPKAETWQPYSIDLKSGTKGKWTTDDTVIRLDFGRKPGLQIQLRGMELRKPTEAEKLNAAELEAIQKRKLEVAKGIESYLFEEDWTAKIDKISADKEQRWMPTSRE